MYFFAVFSITPAGTINRASKQRNPAHLPSVAGSSLPEAGGDMDKRRSGAPLVLICMLAACSGVEDDRSSSQAPAAETSVAWGCDDPQPGHPTAAERGRSSRRVGTLAITSEERHGVPATAITAMAILESGYGWTRLAENTSNLLGWKYSPGASGEERDFWVLECPEKGTSDRFLVFRDRADAVDYVAGQLASSDNYRADTERYRRDRTSGVHVVEAVNRWVDGIAIRTALSLRRIAPTSEAS